MSPIPEISLADILFPDPPAVDLLALPYEDGQLLDHEAQILLPFLASIGPAKILEIGTSAGTTALRMAHVLPRAEIHTVDVPPDFIPANDHLTDHHLINPGTVGRQFIGRPESPRIVQHLADTWNFDFSQVGQPPPTFFFIDGSHSYAYVKNDSEKCFELCDHGVFVWHDVDDVHPGIVSFLNEWQSIGRPVFKFTGTRLAYCDLRDLNQVV